MPAQVPDTLLTLFVVAVLPVCLLRPWVGGLVWCWLSIMSPHRLMSGFAQDMRFGLAVALATLAGVAVTRERRALPRTRETVLLAGLWVVFGLSTCFSAIRPQIAWSQLVEVSKLFLMCGVLLVLIQDRKKLRWLIAVAALSVGVHGVIGAAWLLRTGAVAPVYGPPRSQLYDNNDLAAALVMILPLLALLHGEERSRWRRGILLAVFASSVITVLGTFSRSGFLGLSVVTGGLLLARQWRLLVVGAVAATLFFATTSASAPWRTRMKTMAAPAATAKIDRSVSGRMQSWRVAWRLGVDHPFLGAGFSPFSRTVYEHYLPGYADDHNAHNIFLQVLAEHGFTGLLLYVGVLAGVLFRLVAVYRSCFRDPSRLWLAEHARMIGLGLSAFLVAGLFLCLSYRDLLFVGVVLAVIVDALSREAGGPEGPARPPGISECCRTSE